MHITGLVHININCSDFERSRTFYEMLGFEAYLNVPEDSTVEVANAVGMDSYKVRGALMALKDASQPIVIDLLEWQSPRDYSPPYPNLNRPGLARMALASDNIDADYDFLVQQNVQVVSMPANAAISPSRYARFFCFKDPDGTFLELVEVINAP